jgi:ATP-dependent DNA helicase RecG
VGTLRFVTPERAALLGRLGVRTVADELYNVPRRYVDFTAVTAVRDAPIGAEVTVVVQVDEVELKRPRPRMTVVELRCFDATGVLVVSFFGQPWLANQFKPGQLVAFSGKMGFSYGFKRMSGPLHDLLHDVGEKPARSLGLFPQHRTTEGLSQQWARRIASCALEALPGVLDFWSARVRSEQGLMPLARALRAVHFPRDAAEAEAARGRLAFDEAACLQAALAARRDARLPGVVPVAHVVDGPHAAAVAAALPFSLTADQERAVAQILGDMAAPRPMNRLLLGDVGTGKTAVAVRALAPVADTGTQAAVMAPTGVLARQYAQKVGPVLDAAGVSWALLTGSTPPAERARVLEELAAGRVSVLFGTHALISDDVAFARLSLAIVDEQHRFGVDQRHALREKGRGADLLVMSATPIPRTLALALYGDLDRSYLRQRPVEGAGVRTRVIAKSDRGTAYEAMRAALDEGRQVYVVCPLVGAPAASGPEAEDAPARALDGGADPSDPKAAQTEAEVLRTKVFRGYEVGLLTGRMSAREKDRVMDDFRAGRVQVLVATTVVEVGVDVPNATVMLIEDGERFGLAQLHQLRGRVGRGRWPGQVFVACDARAPASRARMEALERTSDGFELAEEDLRLRREGDIMGRRQSGDVALRFVDLARDLDLIERAHGVVEGLMGEDPELASVYNRPLRNEVIRRYGDVFTEVSGG